MSKPKKGSWIVRVRCTVDKDVVCDDCTEEQARECPWDFASDESEVDQIDWVVKDVSPSE